jgi:pantetheine-phosphate adenylyltransferase
MQKKALYTGTFDPITLGHLDIIQKASTLFDEVIIAVADSKAKKPLFALAQRKAMIEASVAHLNTVKIVSFEGLLINLATELDTHIIIRGVRSVTDFEYEMQMGYANASLKPDLETIFLMPRLEYSFISSSVVRTILAFDGKISQLVTAQTLRLIKEYQA